MGVLLPFTHVTDSWIRNLVFANLLYQFFFLVFHNFSIINYGGDSSVLKIKIISFIHRPCRGPGCDNIPTTMIERSSKTIWTWSTINIKSENYKRNLNIIILSTYHLWFHFYKYSTPLMPKDLTSRA